MIGYRFAVIGDIHANGRALEAALDIAKDAGYDELIFLGDILTYGVNVEAVIDRVAAECAKNAQLLRGNHDALYLSSNSNYVDAYLEKLPPWIRESVAFNKKSLPSGGVLSLPFVDSYVKDSIIFSHANPFGRDDWRYINSELDHNEVCDVLQKRGLRCGVFGHTHRARVFSCKPDNDYFVNASVDQIFLEDGCSPYVINAGSVGQPRNKSKQVFVLFIDIHKERISVCFRELYYDVRSHVEELRSAGFQPETLDKLVSFFVGI